MLPFVQNCIFLIVMGRRIMMRMIRGGTEPVPLANSDAASSGWHGWCGWGCRATDQG